jgi:hypothetical protein
MLGRSPEWTALVEHWQELAELLAQEHPSGSAPRTYARMRELLWRCHAMTNRRTRCRRMGTTRVDGHVMCSLHRRFAPRLWWV